MRLRPVQLHYAHLPPPGDFFHPPYVCSQRAQRPCTSWPPSSSCPPKKKRVRRNERTRFRTSRTPSRCINVCSSCACIACSRVCMWVHCFSVAEATIVRNIRPEMRLVLINSQRNCVEYWYVSISRAVEAARSRRSRRLLSFRSVHVEEFGRDVCVRIDSVYFLTAVHSKRDRGCVQGGAGKSGRRGARDGNFGGPFAETSHNVTLQQLQRAEVLKM